MLVCTNIVYTNRNGISEEVARAGCTASNTGTRIYPGIDRRRASLKCRLCGGFANAMIAQAVYQRILIVNPMWLWRRICCEGAERVIPEVVIPYPGEEGKSRPKRGLARRDDQVIAKGHWLCPEFGRSS